MRNLLAISALCLSSHVLAQTVEAPLRLSGVESQAAHVVELSTGKALYDYCGNRALTPASTTKLFSTAAALLSWGPSHCLSTSIGLDRDSSLLIIHGSFDPTTDSRFFSKTQLEAVADTVASRLAAMHVERVGLVADASLGLFAPYCSKRLWEDMGNYYGAAPSCLMADDNTVDVYFHSPSGVGAHCQVDSIVPSIPGSAGPQSFVRTHAGSADMCNIYSAGTSVWYATGSIPSGRGSFVVRSAMPNPEAHFLRKLASLLALRGVEVSSQRISTERCNWRETSVATIWSPSIADIVAVTNQRSINLFADALTMALPINGTDRKWSHTTWNGAVDNLVNFWEGRIGSKLLIYDGSGLSPAGAVSPQQFTALLSFVGKSSVAGSFEQSLAVMGQSGTLRSMGAKSVIAGKVKAKSGSMSGVLSYAGYMTCASGRKVAFAIIVNHHTEKAVTVKSEVVRWLSDFYRAH